MFICFVEGELDFHDLVRGTPPEDGGPGVDTEFLEEKKKKKEVAKQNEVEDVDANEDESLDEVRDGEVGEHFGLQAQVGAFGEGDLYESPFNFSILGIRSLQLRF